MAGYLGSVPVPQATQHRESFTCTEGQTSFATAGYTPQFLDLYLNGSHLSPADFTATNGSDVILSVAASADDVCDIISYTPFEVNSQTFTGTTTLDGAVVINQSSADVDFRVESNGNANMLFVDGGNNAVGIGAVPSGRTFTITTTDQTDVAIISANDQYGQILFGDPQDDNIGTIGYNHTTDAMEFTTNTALRFRISSDGSLSTPTLGTSNVRFGVNAGNSIASGGNYNTVVGDEAGTAISTGDQNTFFGYSAGATLADGIQNTFVGALTGDATDDGAYNTGVGHAALSANCGNENTAVGYAALTSTTSVENTAVGSGAGFSLTDVSGGVFIGQHSGLFATTASNSTFVGHSAGQGITNNKLTGNDNTAVGTNAGLLLQAGGTTNTLIGKDAGRALTTAEQSCIMGAGAGLVVTGSKNTFVGADCGNVMTTGIKNVILGRYTGNNNSLDLRTSSSNIVLSDGDSIPRLHINSSGQVSMGTSMSFGGSGYGTAGFTFNYNGADYAAAFRSLSSTNSALYGPIIDYVNAAPNGAGNAFISCSDSSASRFRVRSDGGVANFSANDVNLSDRRVKTNIEVLGSMWDKFKAIEIVNFKYKDQSHENLNIGVIAQQVESVAAEFVDNSGWGETVEGEDPLKSIFTTDLYHAAIKALQEAMTRIETLETQNASFEARITALEGA